MKEVKLMEDKKVEKIYEKYSTDNQLNLTNIMELIHWDRDESDQEKGRILACRVEDISVFFQDNAYGGKAVWENCALIFVKNPMTYWKIIYLRY